MIVDASAVVAMVKGEPDAVLFSDLLLAADHPRIATPTWVELNVVCLRQTPLTAGDVDDLLVDHGISSIPFTQEHAAVAAAAYRRFGRGSGHPASLNLGDCFAYAVAIVEGEPLLFKGDDFGHTDVRDARNESIG